MHATPTMAAPMSRAPASLSRGQAAAAAVARPPVPTNLIGKPLDQTPWVPFAPAAERLVTVRLYIDGARMKPPQERLYEDQILWNAYEPAESVRKFSEELCVAEGLPAAYRDEIERAIGRAVVAADAAAHDEAEVPPAGTLTIDVEVERRGKAFRDKVLWDLGGAITPEEYARRTAADLKLPLDMEAGLALAIREAVQQRASSAVSTDVGTAAEVVRSAADAAEWSPEIGAPRPKPPPPPPPPEEPEPPPPPKREPLPKLENGELPEGWTAEEHSSAAGCAARNSAQLCAIRRAIL